MTTEAIRAAVEGIVCGDGGSGPAEDRPRDPVAADPLASTCSGPERSLDRREFDEAGRLLRAAIERDARSAVAHNLMGLLHERLGEHRVRLSLLPGCASGPIDPTRPRWRT